MNIEQPVTEEQTNQSSFVRRMIDSHSVLGLGFAALIYIVSVTGAFTLFVPEISLWENRGVVTQNNIDPNIAATSARNAEAQLKPGNEILNVIFYAPDEFKPYSSVRLNQRPDRNSKLQSDEWLVNPNTGDLMGSADAPYAHFIEDLHTVLHLPNPWGRYLVGLLGVVMFTLILSGIFAHPTIVKDAFKLRLERNARLAWTDIHNRLSVWGLPFHLILTFTGAFLGIAGVTVAALAFIAFDGDQEEAIAVINGPQPILGAPAMPSPPDYASMIKRSQAPDRKFALFVTGNPKDSGQTTSIIYSENGILSMRSSDIYRNDGEFLEKFGGKGSEVGARIFGAVQPLHYGTFGGYPIKMLYFVLALALTYITSSGMMIWFKRKMQQGDPRPRHEGAWRGMTSGLTVGLSVGAVLATLGLSLPLAQICLAIWAVGFAAIYFAPNLLRAVQLSWMLSAALLLIAVAINIGSSIEGATSNLVNGLLVATAIAMAVCASRLSTAATTHS
ncbi:PepSY-associated TM helix domain-containing protein [Parasphingorhabdus cellanae]|uniref:PepSY domain-containing protein n=1 Tax=Parasphingorhabdus cellanae TaxID=2806553 RepID=A0ABX7T3A8_9SPHN|nr:PepSY-associated TM helix domain-containing protein [Parasphingorhabdus cellanae]QTD54463.1 PepSY domain-containing protein [Parasphingorhabdus cellanae]